MTIIIEHDILSSRRDVNCIEYLHSPYLREVVNPHTGDSSTRLPRSTMGRLLSLAEIVNKNNSGVDDRQPITRIVTHYALRFNLQCLLCEYGSRM